MTMDDKIKRAELMDDDATPTVEFTIRPDGTDAEIYCRRLPREVARAIAAKYQKVEWRRGARAVYVPESKQTEYDKDLLDYIILGWKHIASKGVDVEPTRDNKYKLPSGVQLEILEASDAAAVADGENARPNSGASSSD